MRTRRIRILATLVAVASTVLAGCQVDGRQPAVQRWSGLVGELRVQWSAEPGIDLRSGPSVPVRAYIESRWLAQYAGSLDYAYPGFAEAVPPNVDGTPDLGAESRRPNVNVGLSSPLIGNDQFHILSIDGSGRDFKATVCNFTYSVSKKNDDGTYFSVARTESREPRGIFASRVSLVAPLEQSQTALPPQEGPAASPDGDVFRGWQIVGNLNSNSRLLPGFEQDWPTYDADTASCVKKAPDPPARIAFLIDGDHPRSDFPTSPPSPGWPQKNG